MLGDDDLRARPATVSLGSPGKPRKDSVCCQAGMESGMFLVAPAGTCFDIVDHGFVNIDATLCDCRPLRHRVLYRPDLIFRHK